MNIIRLKNELIIYYSSDFERTKRLFVYLLIILFVQHCSEILVLLVKVLKVPPANK